ncbi:MAG: sugar kinase [bacterium]|nr:sugar kinase [bacterium]
MGLEKAVVIHRRTGLDELIRRHATLSQVRFYLESRGESFENYVAADSAYKDGMKKTLAGIPRGMRIEQVEKEFLGTYQFSDKDLIIVAGDDGLLVNTAKYAQAQPVIFVNTDTERFDGVLASCTPTEFEMLAKSYLGEPWALEYHTMAEAQLEDGQVLYALNDLFIGKRNHSSSRYTIKHIGKSEKQSTSGIIVSTGTGSSGWLTSIIRGARGIVDALEEKVEERKNEALFPYDAPYLVYSVREPFSSKITGTKLVYGKVCDSQPLEIVSHMPENGIIFSDGIENDCLEFTAGKKVTIQPAKMQVGIVKLKKGTT